MALGFFDGVHIGHAALLRRTVERAYGAGARPSVMSFDTHPDCLVLGRPVRLLGDTRSRAELINRISGIEDVVFISFNRETMNMPWDGFLSSLRAELNVCGIVAGEDFTFGKGGKGNAEKLKNWCGENSLTCDIIPQISIDGVPVSSSLIREYVAAGEMEKAAGLLGHYHCLTGIVRQGYHIGRKLMAPTANLYFPEGVLFPAYGVYATEVTLKNGEVYTAATNIGVRPTFDGDSRVSVECNLVGFDGSLYDEEVRVDFISYIRPEKKFLSPEELAEQISRDRETVIQTVQRIHNFHTLGISATPKQTV